jgi:hypothetical protein
MWGLQHGVIPYIADRKPVVSRVTAALIVVGR